MTLYDVIILDVKETECVFTVFLSMIAETNSYLEQQVLILFEKRFISSQGFLWPVRVKQS